MTERRALALGAALAALWTVVALWAVHPTIVGTFNDDGIYLATARSLAEGRGYRSIHLPTEPWQTKYPPLWPLVLAPVWKIAPRFPDNVLAFKALGILCVGATALVTQRLALRRGLATPAASLAVVAIYLGSWRLLTSVNFVLSEPLFSALSTAALLLLGGEPGPGRRGVAREAAGATAAALAYLVRSQGVVLLVAATAGLALRRRWRALALVTLAGAGAVGGWWAWRSAHGNPPSLLLDYYVSYSTFLGAEATGFGGRHVVPVMRRHLAEIPSSIAALVVPASLRTNFVQGLILLGLAVVGGVGCVRRREHVLPLYLAGTIAMLWVLPWIPDRLALPIVPPLLVLAAAGVAALANRWAAKGGRLARKVPAGLAVAVLVTQLAILAVGLRAVDRESLPHYEQLSTGRREWADFEAAFSWVRAHVPADDGLGSVHDSLWYLYTGRRGLHYWLFHPAEHWLDSTLARVVNPGDPTTLLAELDRLGVRWLVVDHWAVRIVPGGHVPPHVARRILALAAAGARLEFRSPSGAVEVWKLHADRG